MTLPSPIIPLPKLLPRRQYVGVSDVPHLLTEDEIQEYLEDTKDLKDTLDLWNKTSGIPGLLNTVLQTEVKQQAYKPVATYFDEVTGVWRYVGSNYRVPASRVRLGILRMSHAVEIEMRDLTTQLVNGTITREEWYSTMRTLMKNEYRASWLASIGGTANYTRSEISKFGWAMRPHYRWLNNFMDQIITGQHVLSGRTVVRAGMYGRAANSIYQNNLLRIAEQNGMNECRRMLGPNEQHCHDTNRPGCIELAQQGWVKIGDMVQIGEATCLTFCLCRFVFRK